MFANFFASPPPDPRKAIENIFWLLACFKTLIIFFDFPEVDIAIRISPLFPSADRVLENMFENPMSFPQAVIVEVS